MRRALAAGALGALLVCGGAAAVPGLDEPDAIQVNGIRKPEVHKYKAILAGLDSFDKHHALAPDVPALRFRIRALRGAGMPEQPRVRIEGEDGFVLPLALDAANRFTVPRSEAAVDADGELALNQKHRFYRVEPDVRTPGLPDNVRRLGDLRLECRVTVAIAKEEMSLLWVLAINGVLRTRDWCGFTLEDPPKVGFDAGAPIVAATLREGERSQPLEARKTSFDVALSDASWSDEALVELEFGAPAAPAGVP
ncbi:hypothetical protein [Massilia sp.]|uniref:hypothetical protein n=1 Tax=Massilia sp. TaxID=1882437 RepID=UPI0028B135AC|nr:hypothetical protein [Massilia sp.]